MHGRAAVVVPDNVLFEGGAGETIRRELLKQADDGRAGGWNQRCQLIQAAKLHLPVAQLAGRVAFRIKRQRPAAHRQQSAQPLLLASHPEIRPIQQHDRQPAAF